MRSPGLGVRAGSHMATVLSESSLVVGISISITRPGPQSEVGSIHSDGRR